MNLDSIWAQIELEQTWRTDEIRFFDNQASKLEMVDQEKFRRANILLLYAHYEGFCKFVFIVYLDAVNNEGISCSDANFSLAAATLEKVFYELRNPESKAVEFKNSLPDDKKLHVFARDKEFIENSTNFQNRIVSISEKVVDTESNLKPVVLRKTLYRLGFPHDGLKTVEGDISWLLNIRNEIAHGANGRGISAQEYEKLRRSAFKVMDTVKRYVMDALTAKEYLRV